MRPLHNQPEHENAGLPVPDSLVRALRELSQDCTVTVPQTVDARILASARLHLVQAGERAQRTAPRSLDSTSDPAPRPHSNNRRAIPFPVPWLRWAALAACVVLLGTAVWLGIGARRDPHGIALEHPTILDAFALARRLESGVSLRGDYDLNDDGSVNRIDVSLLALRAVALRPGGDW